MVVLIDCDNFFASCERVMQPQYAKKPVVVLSNNDGCVIARSNEVKAAGVAMGQPYFMCKETLDNIGAVVFSANFLLYRHFAKRLQGIFRTLPTESIDIYSIDESFLQFKDGQIKDVNEWGVSLRKLILEWTGIPVSIGIAPSRALAKIATKLAKKSEKGVGVIDESTGSERSLRQIAIADVWGVGRRLAPKFQMLGVKTAWDLVQIKPNSPIITFLDKPMKELIFQLKGWNIQISNVLARKSLMRSRTFGKDITSLEDVRSSLVDFSSQIAAKLRAKNLCTDQLILVLYKKNSGSIRGIAKVYKESFEWTNDLFRFSEVAERAAQKLFTQGEVYCRAMVRCESLRSEKQLSMGYSKSNDEKNDSLLDAIYALESLYGPAGPQIATKLLSNGWHGKRQLESPYNHSEWNKLPQVNAG